jgi:hypothetical protein
MTVDSYIRAAREKIRDEARDTISRLQDLARDNNLELYWVKEEFLKAMREAVKEADNE